MPKDYPTKNLVPDNATLVRLPDVDDEVHHRALLLYAMQDYDRRNLQPIALIVSRGYKLVSQWCVRRKWKLRIKNTGLLHQQIACKMYRELYFGKYGMHEIAHVEDRMSIPFLTSSPPAEPDAPKTGLKLAEAAGNSTEREKFLSFQKRSKLLIEALIGSLAERIRTKGIEGISVRVADLPMLLREHASISERLGLVDAPSSTVAALEPTFRVSQAVQKQQSVASAQLEDIEELRVVLGGIVQMERVKTEMRPMVTATDERDVIDNLVRIPAGIEEG